MPVLAEIEIAWRIAEAEAPGTNRWVAVTGTNGKSTTTAWIAEILRRAGRPVALAGQHRRAALRRSSADRAPRDFVCEVSSFQLEAIERFRRARRGPDQHHAGPPRPLRGLRGVRRARRSAIFANQRPEDFAVVNADDAAVACRSRPRARRVALLAAWRRRPAGAWVEKAARSSRRSPERAARRRRGAPRAAGRPQPRERAGRRWPRPSAWGRPRRRSRRALTGFRGLPHRTELVAEAARRAVGERLQGNQRGRDGEVARGLRRRKRPPDPRRARQARRLRGARAAGRAHARGPC